jgi:hypothetical protein
VLTQYSDSLNKFTQYLLERPVRISGAFYVGTIQTTDDNLNIGLDTYDNAAANLFYNASGSWIASSIAGAPMIRPVIGKPLPLGIANLASEKGSMKIYPNPCSTGQVHITMDEPGMFNNMENWTLSISGLTGQKLHHSPASEVVDVSGLPSGIYIIEAQNNTTLQHLVSKLVIMK